MVFLLNTADRRRYPCCLSCWTPDSPQQHDALLILLEVTTLIAKDAYCRHSEATSLQLMNFRKNTVFFSDKILAELTSN